MNSIARLRTSLLVLWLAWGLVCQGQPAQTPILQLDPGGHMAPINDIVFTPDGRYLLSAGDDKAVRVWDIASGRTVRSLRGQIGAGNAGKVYAMALSPDASMLAVAGYMAVYQGGNATDVGAVRLYDFASGELVARLIGHSNVVIALDFSPDGRYLASASFDDTAIVWDLATRRPLHVLQGHEDDLSAVAFSPDSERVATGSDDRELRLWRVKAGELITRMQGHEGPVKALAFSSEGVIASAAGDYTIRFWDGKNGRALKTLIQQETEAGSLSFSPDGGYLLAGVSGGADTDCRVYRVADGKLMHRYQGHDNAVLATAVSPSGRLAATGGGSQQEIHLWSLLDGELKQTLAGIGSSIWAVGFSADGRWLAWGKTQGVLDPQTNTRQAPPLEYELRLPGEGEVLGVPQPVRQARSFITDKTEHGDWSLRTQRDAANVLEIRKDSQVIATVERGSKDGVRHRVFTFTPDGETVISGGANGVIKAYNRLGEEIGDFKGHTSDIWALAVSPDGKLLASSGADQTVRLWDIDYRELLISLFHGRAAEPLGRGVVRIEAEPSVGEWIAWTRSGYFNTSARGDRYVGWHQNQGLDAAARYYPVAQFATQRYQPQLVSDAIEFRSETEALGRLQRRRPDRENASAATLIAKLPQPPKIIQAPPATVPDATQTLVVGLGEQTDTLIVSLNGRPLQRQRGVERLPEPPAEPPTEPPDGEVRTVTRSITLAPGANRIELLARNEFGDSAVVALDIEHQTNQPAPTQQELPDYLKPNLYILAIGVSNYADERLNLGYAAVDAEALLERFQQENQKTRKLYNEVHTKVLTDQQATRSNVLEAMDFLMQMTENDLAILFVAGHGLQDQRGNFYFLPHDIEVDSLRSTGVKWEEFHDITSSLPGKVILLADTCHSGDIYGTRGRRAALDMTQLAREFSDAGSGVIVFASSQGKEFSEEDPAWNHGAFTKSLLDGLNGAADFVKDDIIHQSELEVYVKRGVVNLTDGRQHPVTIRPDAITDFAIAVAEE